MVTVELDELPDALHKLASTARDIGWSVWSTYSEAKINDEQVNTIAVRFGHGEYRAYGVWKIGETATGKESIKWDGGAATQLDAAGRQMVTFTKFDTLARLGAHLGIAQKPRKPRAPKVAA